MKQNEKVVIVIDPGHGGDNEGTTENGFLEKEMDLVTAQAMYEELIQFDNVQVYLTRTEDVKISLAERAKFAASVEADFLFSIHYNASGNHTLFGSEVWVSCETPYNALGYQFGRFQMREMEEMGLYLRGIKTRVNDKGTDYYGIIRESAKQSIPAVIIEHCHVDEKRDIPFCDTEEEWIALGKANAQAVAKYFGLSSEALDVDYRLEAGRFPEVNTDLIVESTLRDETPPDICQLKFIRADYYTGFITLELTSADYDSPMLYYSYSLDGGKSFSALYEWPVVDVLSGMYEDTFQIPLQVSSDQLGEIVFRAYNLADLYSESNIIPFMPVPIYDMDAIAERVEQAAAQRYESTQTSEELLSYTTVNTEAVQNEAIQDNMITILEIVLIVTLLLFAVVLVSQMFFYRVRRKRRQRRKDGGENKYQPK